MQQPDYRVRDVAITLTEVTLTLASGHVLPVPLRGYPRLVKASPHALAQWQLVDDGHGLVWPALLEPSARGMINVFTLLWDGVFDGALQRLAAANHQLTELSPTDRELVALFRLEADVNNGGFLQFFCNWGEETCGLAMQALEHIGARAMLAIVQHMHAILDRLEDDPRIVQLTDLYAAMTDAEHQEMGDLDRAFWAYPDDIGRLGVLRFGV